MEGKPLTTPPPPPGGKPLAPPTPPRPPGGGSRSYDAVYARLIADGVPPHRAREQAARYVRGDTISYRHKSGKPIVGLYGEKARKHLERQKTLEEAKALMEEEQARRLRARPVGEVAA